MQHRDVFAPAPFVAVVLGSRRKTPRTRTRMRTSSRRDAAPDRRVSGTESRLFRTTARRRPGQIAEIDEAEIPEAETEAGRARILELLGGVGRLRRADGVRLPAAGQRRRDRRRRRAHHDDVDACQRNAIAGLGIEVLPLRANRDVGVVRTEDVGVSGVLRRVR